MTESANNDLKENAIRGGFVRLCSQGAGFILRLSSMMVLSRILDAKDFGLVAMVMAVMGILNLFKDFALSSATIQRTTVTDEQISTLFWINMLVGAILAVLSLALAPALSTFYREPRLLTLTAVLALAFVFNAAGVQHSALLQREMRFVTLAVIETCGLLIGTVVAIGMAVRGYGYWALVALTIISPLVLTVCFWLTTKWIPGRPRRGVGLHSMMRFGGAVTLTNLVNYVAFNAEKVLLGRVWGAEVIGLYGRGYQLVNIPTDNLLSSLGGVVFAALSRVQNDPKRLKSGFLKGYSLILAMTLPITVICAIFAGDLTDVVLGSKWNDAAIIVKLLAPTILVVSMIIPLSWFLHSIGMVERTLKMSLVMAPLVIMAYFVGLPYGPNGVAFSYSAAMVVWLVPHILWATHGTLITPRDILLTAGRPLVSGAIAAAVALAITSIYGHLLPVLPRLVLETGLLFSVYLAMLLYVMGQKMFYVDLIRGLRRRRSIEPDALALT